MHIMKAQNPRGIRNLSFQAYARCTNKKKPGMLLLTALTLLLLGISLAALFFQNSRKAPAGTACVYQDGKLLCEIDLSAVKEPYTFVVTSRDGGHNTIRVERGAIGIVDADCPDKLCQKMGMLKTSAYPVSCLPHKLLIKISAAGGSGLDAVAQ